MRGVADRGKDKRREGRLVGADDGVKRKGTGEDGCQDKQLNEKVW